MVLPQGQGGAQARRDRRGAAQRPVDRARRRPPSGSGPMARDSRTSIGVGGPPVGRFSIPNTIHIAEENEK